ncbi:unnamed protein product [Amoebophrya sp. A120]|nr:unnamed protein product [Amoebophrya sp. A120]|eukprot:GSA120T00008347001.1
MLKVITEIRMTTKNYITFPTPPSFLIPTHSPTQLSYDLGSLHND